MKNIKYNYSDSKTVPAPLYYIFEIDLKIYNKNNKFIPQWDIIRSDSLNSFVKLEKSKIFTSRPFTFPKF